MSASALSLSARERVPLPRWVAPAAVASVAVGGGVGLATDSVSVAVIVVLAASAGVGGWADVVLRRIPNSLCAALAGFAVVVAAIAAPVPVASVGVGAVVTSLPFAVLHAIDPAWVGFGDVKLLVAVGAVLGLVSPFAGLGAAWLAGVAGVVSRPWVPESWRRSVPFGFWLSAMSVPVAVWVGVVT